LDFLAKRKHPQERVGPLAAELTEMTHRGVQQILQLGERLVHGGEQFEELEIHLPLLECLGRQRPFDPR